MAKNVLRNPARALDLTAKLATAAASRNSKLALSTLPELITFYNSGKGLYLCKFDKILVYNWTRKQIDCIPQHHLKIKNFDLEQRLEKKINDVNSFNNHINNIKEMIKGKNNKSKKKLKNIKR